MGKLAGLNFHGRLQNFVRSQSTAPISNSRGKGELSYPPRFSIFAHVSRSVTVRLKTGFSGVESRSTQK